MCSEAREHALAVGSIERPNQTKSSGPQDFGSHYFELVDGTLGARRRI
jgi:hypothetical protein